MVLATVIRLEFAYPGVGVFAGDSLQYLSLVTAHGVIMVFFMIMPLLLGAFANFLLPTQLGVHDVAFPRLNSAAFWFLPGGLLMLAQLVCIDRRYQRMNCFNIREIESILKKRFFSDLSNTHDHKKFLHKTMTNLKFKINNEFSNPNLFLFYNFGIEFSPKNRSNFYISNENDNFKFLNENGLFSHVLHFYKNSMLYYGLNNFFSFFFHNFSNTFGFHFLFKNLINYFTVSTINLFSFCKTFSFSLFNNFFFIFNKAFTKYYAYFNFFNSVIINSIKTILNRIFDLFCSAWTYVFSEISKITIILELFSILMKNILNFLLKEFTYFSFNFFEFFFFVAILEFFYIVNNFIFKFKNMLNSNFLYSFFYLNYEFFFYNFNIFNKLFKSSSSTDYLLIHSSYLNYDSKDKFFFNKINLKKNNFVTPEVSEFYSYYNFNSHISYLYAFLGTLTQLPIVLIRIIVSLFNFEELALLVNTFINLLVTWYVPLLVNDNLFYALLRQFSILAASVENFLFLPNYFYFSLPNTFFSHFQIYLNINFFVILNSIYFFFLTPFNHFYHLFLNFFNCLTVLLFDFKLFFIFDFLYSFFINGFIFFDKKNKSQFFYDSKFFSNRIKNEKISNQEEIFLDYRYLKFDNPIFKYDYKSGDYYPKLYKEVYPFLFTSLIELTGGLRQPTWYFSQLYSEVADADFSSFTTTTSNIKILDKMNSISAFYNFFFILNTSTDVSFFNKRWFGLNAFDQKFYKFFQTSSLQQRIYNNWRQLKFTREAWRCKLLMSRHQKTLFKRYVNEDGVFWSIERNAKDLLPGWAMITPFSSRTRFTAIGKTDIGLMGVLLVLNSSIISAANFIVTYRYLSTLNNRKMRDARSFFTEAIMVSSWMMIAANPMLVIGIIMLLSDRHWQTSFFDYSGGGDTVLFQHMFWFFGHPEVYIIILPTFGFVNTMLSYYLKKRISARASLLYSMYTIAFLGFFVWGHHMYMVGLAHTTRMLFSTLTVMISVPAATKLMHWCVTTANSSFAMELPLVYTLTFIFLFVSGGISGMCVAHTGMDVLFHDTFYVIGHFHVMLAGAAMIGSFGAFYFYFVAIFGVKYSRIYAYLHFTYYIIGQLFTVVPMFWLGYAGMPRRVLDYPASFGGWHSVISGGHMLSVAGLIAFFIMIFDSLRQAKAVVRNTFGIGRYNTRLNFYIYEIAKLQHFQEKAWALFKFIHKYSIKLNNLNYYNLEPYETTLFSYSFSKK